jgi:cytochrome P450
MSTLVSPLRQTFPWINNKKFFNAIDEFNGFIVDIIETKKNKIKHNETNSYSGHVDLLTNMLKFSKEEGINADIKQLRDEMIAFFVAGHDSKFG